MPYWHRKEPRIKRVDREHCPEVQNEGRVIRKAYGPDGAVKRNDVDMGFLLITAGTKDIVYRPDKCETYVVEEAKGARIRYGGSGETLCDAELLEKYDVVVAGKGDVYQFEFDDKDSYVKLMYFIP